MPVVDYDLNRTWASIYARKLDFPYYQQTGHPLFGQRVIYGRDFAKAMMAPEDDDITWHKLYWAGLAPQLSVPVDATIAFIGAGFGFLSEAATAAGYTNVQAVDDSNWIHEHKTDLAYRWDGAAWVQDEPNAAVVIIQASLDNPASLRNALGGRQDLVITDGMLSSLQSPADPNFTASLESDELTDAFNNAEGIVATGGTILHIVSPNIRHQYHRKTAAEWKALRPGHLFVADIHNSPVL